MANYPDIHHLKLEKCCIETINRINKLLGLANILSIGVGAGVWANIFGPSPATLNTIVSVSQVDYSSLSLIVQATASIRVIAKRKALDMCLYEQLRHNNNNKLSLFWEGMANAFAN